ncbi:hypothetical protein GCK32_000211 [Trichostrongylus colubriformis]|uniref:Uncharacterized protein n=1 Tax=Trichostrongylus colubriformis TaxID=6319 RepID=A0AAN8F8V0_TRICO
MLEDVLYEILPVVGFALSASSIFILVVMRKAVGVFRFTLWFGAIDLIAGLATVYAGFYGIVATVYGRTGELTTPIKCLFGAIHVPAWLFLDIFHMAVLSLFCLDRLVFMIVPVVYARASRFYLNWPVILLLGLISCAITVPAFSLSIESYKNASVVIPALCRLDSVTGQNYYHSHVLALQWMPISGEDYFTDGRSSIAGMGCIMLALLLYGIRGLKQRWRYNWSEESVNTKQLFVASFLRCFLMGVAVHMPVLFLYNSPERTQLHEVRDVLIRLSIYSIVSVLQPLWYVLVMPEFCTNVGMLFNQYGQNTERKWQSAGDPPQGDEHVDKFGDQNPFGSWYSAAGNVTGEAGLPIGNERSVSFYYDRM